MLALDFTFSRYKAHADVREGSKGMQRDLKRHHLIIFVPHVFGMFKSNARITIRRHKVVYRLFNEPKMLEVK